MRYASAGALGSASYPRMSASIPRISAHLGKTRMIEDLVVVTPTK